MTFSVTSHKLLFKGLINVLFVCCFSSSVLFLTIKQKFLIKWRGRNDHENSWEYLSCLDYINAVINDNNGLLDNSVSVVSIILDYSKFFFSLFSFCGQ